MRLCIVDGRKAIFHRWEQYRAIVEYEDGSVKAVAANEIKFEGSKKIIEKLEKQVGKWQTNNGSAKSVDGSKLQSETEEEDEEEDLEAENKSEFSLFARPVPSLLFRA